MNDNRQDRDGRPDDAPADGTQVNELTGQPDDRVGYQMPDPKDDHQARYTTTPADDRVGSADEGKYEPVQVQDPKEVTGQFDHLATRDPEKMEHRLQNPEFAGAETVAGLAVPETTLDSSITMSGGLGSVSTSLAQGVTGLRGVDQNPGYTPPSEEVPPHFRDHPGDLPAGTTPELQNEVSGEIGDRERQ